MRRISIPSSAPPKPHAKTKKLTNIGLIGLAVNGLTDFNCNARPERNKRNMNKAFWGAELTTAGGVGWTAILWLGPPPVSYKLEDRPQQRRGLNDQPC